jgi:hypothetical protein
MVCDFLSIALCRPKMFGRVENRVEVSEPARGCPGIPPVAGLPIEILGFVASSVTYSQ